MYAKKSKVGRLVFFIRLSLLSLFVRPPRLYSLVGLTLLLCGAVTTVQARSRAPQDLVLEKNLNTVLEARLRDYNSRASSPISSDEARARIAAFKRPMKDFAGDSSSDWIQLKAAFEIGMVSANKGSPSVYNRDARSVYDAVCNGKANCQAGTDLFIAGAIDAWGPYRTIQYHLAVIFSNGHIQPGYFKRDSRGDWTLQRIETTATSVQPQDLGPTSRLGMRGPLRIIMVDDYLRMEADRANGLPRERILSEQLPEALARVQADFGVPVDELERLIRERASISGKVDENDRDSLLGFGKVDVPPEDQRRRPEFGQINAWSVCQSENPKASSPASEALKYGFDNDIGSCDLIKAQADLIFMLKHLEEKEPNNCVPMGLIKNTPPRTGDIMQLRIK